MGTSSSQRSPRTPEWERVQRLYDDPQVPPRVIVAQIVDALDAQTRADMADAAVARCLGTLTGASAGRVDDVLLSLDPSLPAAQDLAAALRACARSDIALHREGSRFGELALDALASSALELGRDVPDDRTLVRAALARYAHERKLSELANTFVSRDLGYAFRYFVERDTPAHVGGPRLSTAADANRLAGEIAGICRDTTRRLAFGGLEDDLWRAVDRGRIEGQRLNQEVLRAALGDSLRALGVNP